jgi:hypothetical protein
MPDNDSYDPRWIAKIYVNDIGQDYLGLRLVQETITGHVLPGITTITPRARFYPFYCWVMVEYVERHPKGWGFNTFLKHREQIFGLANVAHDESVVGLTGVEAFREHWLKHKKRTSVPLELDEYVQDPRGGYAAYSGVIQKLGLVREHDDDSGWEVTSDGQKLASGFKEAIAQTAYYRNRKRYDKAKSISSKVLREYGAYCHLDKLAQGSDLRPTLNVLFSLSAPFSPEPQAIDTSPVGNMRGTLGLVLEMIDQSPKAYDDDVFRKSVLYGSCPDYQIYQPSPELGPVLVQWQVFHLRDLYTYALYALWAYFLYWLRLNGRASLDAYLDHLVESVDLSALVDKGSIHLSDNRPEELTLCSYLESILEAAEIAAGSWKDYCRAFSAQSTRPANEHKLYELLDKMKPDLGVTYFETAWLMLAMLYLRTEGLVDNKIVRYWADYGNARRRSLSLFTQGMNLRIKDSTTVSDTWRWIFRDYIIAQHTITSLEKWRDRKANTFHFRFEDGWFEWIRDGRPSFAASRFSQAHRMLADLDLYQVHENSDQCSLTPRGRAVLDEVVASCHDYE